MTNAESAPTLGKPDYTSLEFPPAPADRPYVLVNMVSSVDGRTVIEETERGLGSKVDQRLMRELRTNADVVLNGASTLRASGSSPRLGDEALEELRVARGRSRVPIGAVVSASGELPLERPFFTAEDFEAVVYLSESAPAERRAAVEGTGRPVVSVPRGDEIPSMLRHMRRELGAEVVLVEGGPTLNGQLLEAGMLDELFVTVGPLLVGGSEPRTAIEQLRAPSLEGVTRLVPLSVFLNPETGELYLRYAVHR